MVSFDPDGIVEAFPVANFGLHTRGEPGAAQQPVKYLSDQELL